MEAIAARNDGVGRRLFVRMALAGAACSLAFSKARADTRLVSRAAAFLLGDQLSLAALLYAQGKAGDVNAPLAKAKSIAGALGVMIRPFPARSAATGDDPKATADIIHYLIAGDGWSIASLLAVKYDRAHSVLFEIAVKSNLLLVLYQPGDDSGIAAVIKSRCMEIALPPAAWQGLVDAVEAKRPLPDVHRALLAMHRDVLTYLLKRR
jgi:hypothetical protein